MTSASALEQNFDTQKALQRSQAAIGQELSNYRFVDQNGKPFELSSLKGKPLVISLIYTSCHHVCPTTTQHLKKVVKKARDALGEQSFNVVTIGFDTYNDTPDAMRYFANKQGVDVPGWYFLSADRTTINALSQELGFEFYTSGKGFDHLNQASVLNSKGKIYRQVYGMTFETPKLVEPLKDLVFGHESPAPSSFLSHVSNRIRLFCTVYDPRTDRYVFDYSIFIGMAIGVLLLTGVAVFIYREWRHTSA